MSPEMLALLLKSFWETCYMVLASTILATLIGVPLGVILTVTRKNHILPNAPVNSVLGAIVNATRSTPFIILMVAIIPLTRLLVGSSIGTTASIVPLTISAAPFIARIIESSLLEIDHGVIEAAQAMGASPTRIIARHLLPNTLSVVIVRVTLSIPSAIFSEAYLSYIGLGIPLPMCSWGSLAQLGIENFRIYPWQLIIPAVCISLTMLAFNMFGDGLRDAFDPKLRR